MTTIVEFLTHRFNEIEAVAKAAPPGDWELSDRGWQLRLTADEPAFERIATVDQPTRADRLAFDHIARHDPEYELRVIEANRAILAVHTVQGCLTSDYSDCTACMDVDTYDAYPCRTVRLLALPFDQHPEFDENWRPLCRSRSAPTQKHRANRTGHTTRTAGTAPTPNATAPTPANSTS